MNLLSDSTVGRQSNPTVGYPQPALTAPGFTPSRWGQPTTRALPSRLGWCQTIGDTPLDRPGWRTRSSIFTYATRDGPSPASSGVRAGQDDPTPRRTRTRRRERWSANGGNCRERTTKMAGHQRQLLGYGVENGLAPLVTGSGHDRHELSSGRIQPSSRQWWRHTCDDRRKTASRTVGQHRRARDGPGRDGLCPAAILA